MIINICNCRSSWVFAGNAKRCLPCSHWLRWFSTNCFHIKNLLIQFPSIKKVAIDSYNLDNRLYIFDAGQLIANNYHPAAFTSKIYVICRIELWSKRCSPCCTFACTAQEIRLLNKDPSLDQNSFFYYTIYLLHVLYFYHLCYYCRFWIKYSVMPSMLEISFSVALPCAVHRILHFSSTR